MNFLPSWKYQLSGMKWPLIVYYIVITALMILIGISMTLAARQSTSFSVSGLEIASMIFLFVVGLNSFRQSFHMLSANGVSRKTLFISFLAVIGTAAAGMALIDSVLGQLMKAFGRYQPAFVQLYGLSEEQPGAVFGIGFLWMLCSNLAAAMAGYLITTLYYRMNKPVKLLVSIGVPVLVLFVLPAVDSAYFGGAVMKAISRFVAWASGLSGGNPYIAMASNVVLTAVFAGLSYLAVRRAPVKAAQQ